MTNDQAAEILPHRRFDQPQLIVVAGVRGSGKTYWIQKWINEAEPRLLVLDPFDKDFAGIRRRLDYRRAIAELRETADKGAQSDRYIPQRRRIVPEWGHLDPEAKFKGNCRDYADRFMEAVVEACPTGAPPLNIRLVLDELSLYVGRNIRGTAFETLVLQGRRMGVSMIVATQRTMRIPIEMRSEVTEMLCFHAHLRGDVETYEEFGWEEAETEAKTLRKGECYYINTGMPE
jgi:hypothetical protein